MPCRQFHEILPLVSGADVEEPEATRLQEHLSGCPTCSAQARSYAEQRHLLKSYGRRLGEGSQVWPEIRSLLSAKVRFPPQC